MENRMYSRIEYIQRPKMVLVDFGVATVDTEKTKQLYTLPSPL